MKRGVKKARQVAAELRPLVEAWCRERGGVEMEPSSYNEVIGGTIGGTWRVQTLAGAWFVHLPSDPSTDAVFINTRFDDPERAAVYVGTASLNPYSGKWNSAYGVDESTKTADLFKDWRAVAELCLFNAEVRPVLLGQLPDRVDPALRLPGLPGAEVAPGAPPLLGDEVDPALAVGVAPEDRDRVLLQRPGDVAGRAPGALKEGGALPAAGLHDRDHDRGLTDALPEPAGLDVRRAGEPGRDDLLDSAREALGVDHDALPGLRVAPDAPADEDLRGADRLEVGELPGTPAPSGHGDSVTRDAQGCPDCRVPRGAEHRSHCPIGVALAEARDGLAVGRRAARTWADFGGARDPRAEQTAEIEGTCSVCGVPFGGTHRSDCTVMASVAAFLKSCSDPRDELQARRGRNSARQWVYVEPRGKVFLVETCWLPALDRDCGVGAVVDFLDYFVRGDDGRYRAEVPRNVLPVALGLAGWVFMEEYR